MIRYLLLLPLSIGFTLLAYLLAPILPLFAKDGWLPRWLWYFQTPDNPLYGDEGHEKRWNNAHSYAQMVAWLWRNPAYGFEWDGPLAAHIAQYAPMKLWGDAWIKNRDNARAGWYFCTVGGYWNFKCIVPLFGDLAFMGEWGWKLQPWAQNRAGEGRAMYVFSIRLTAFYPASLVQAK